MRTQLIAACLTLVCTMTPLAAQNTLTPYERATGWRLLFDGKTTNGWRNFKSDSIASGWQVVDGTLARVGPAGDIITVDQYDNFELVLDWKVAPGGNSGIMFRVTEDADATYHTGPEMQILDNAGHADGQNPMTSTGSNYALHAPTKDAVKPAGEWNTVRLVVNRGHVEHWLNGKKIVQYELWRDEWKKLVAASKFAAWPKYGMNRKGHIALQDHGDAIAFRNIKILPLE